MRLTPALAIVALGGLLSGGALFGAEIGPRHVVGGDGREPAPIVAVDNVCAWPNLTVLRDGSIVATIFNQPSHGSLAGDVDCWASSDGGRTWQKRGTPARHDPDTNRMNVAAGRARSGDLVVIASGWSDRYAQGKRGAPFRHEILPAWVCRSADGGRSWSVDRESFPAKGPNGGIGIPFGDVLSGADGALCVAVYCPPERRNDRVYVYRSDDDGRTWGKPAALDEKNYRNETALLHLGGGRWLAAARSDGLDLYASTDDARSWSHRTKLTGKACHPGHLLKLGDGRLLLSYGNRTKERRGVEVRFGDPEGRNWSEPLVVAPFEGDGGYPASAGRPDGQIVTAYYASRTREHPRYHMGVVIWDPKRSAQ